MTKVFVWERFREINKKSENVVCEKSVCANYLHPNTWEVSFKVCQAPFVAVRMALRHVLATFFEDVFFHEEKYFGAFNVDRTNSHFRKLILQSDRNFPNYSLNLAKIFLNLIIVWSSIGNTSDTYLSDKATVTLWYVAWITRKIVSCRKNGWNKFCIACPKNFNKKLILLGIIKKFSLCDSHTNVLTCNQFILCEKISRRWRQLKYQKTSNWT